MESRWKQSSKTRVQLGDKQLGDRDQLTRKSTIQRINLGLTSSFKSLLAMSCGCMALKAEEKSMKRIRTNEPCFSRFTIAQTGIVQKSECCVFGASVVLVRKLVWV